MRLKYIIPINISYNFTTTHSTILVIKNIDRIIKKVGYTRYKDKEQKSKVQGENKYLEVRGWWKEPN